MKQRHTISDGWCFPTFSSLVRPIVVLSPLPASVRTSVSCSTIYPFHHPGFCVSFLSSNVIPLCLLIIPRLLSALVLLQVVFPLLILLLLLLSVFLFFFLSVITVPSKLCACSSAHSRETSTHTRTHGAHTHKMHKTPTGIERWIHGFV